VSKPSQIEATGQILPRFIEEIDLLGVTYKIRRHPYFLRLKHIDQWIKDYEYKKEYQQSLDLEDMHTCWLVLREQYEAIKKGFENEQWQRHNQKNTRS